MTPTGSFSPIVTATSGVLMHTAGLSLEVGSGPDFSLSAGPSSQTVTGPTVKYLIGVSALSGFTGKRGLRSEWITSERHSFLQSTNADRFSNLGSDYYDERRDPFRSDDADDQGYERRFVA